MAPGNPSQVTSGTSAITPLGEPVRRSPTSTPGSSAKCPRTTALRLLQTKKLLRVGKGPTDFMLLTGTSNMIVSFKMDPCTQPLWNLILCLSFVVAEGYTSEDRTGPRKQNSPISLNSTSGSTFSASSSLILQTIQPNTRPYATFAMESRASAQREHQQLTEGLQGE